MNRFGVQCHLGSPRVRSNFEAVQQAQQLELRVDSDSWDDAQGPLADSETPTECEERSVPSRDSRSRRPEFFTPFTDFTPFTAFTSFSDGSPCSDDPNTVEAEEISADEGDPSAAFSTPARSFPYQEPNPYNNEAPLPVQEPEEVQAETQEERLLDAAQAIAQQAHGRMVEAAQEIARQAQERLLQVAHEISQQTQARLMEAAQGIAQQPREDADEEAQARLVEAAQDIGRQAQERLVLAARVAMPPLRLPSAMTVNPAG